MDALSDSFYSSPEWRAARDLALDRDGSRCTVARLLGGRCSGTLHVHHIEKRRDRPELAFDQDNLATVCASHHPVWESLRAFLQRRRDPLPPCRHRHPYRIGREECERRRRAAAGLLV